jgi:hypothetical protein
MATQVPKNGDMSQLLGPGENPNGFVAQTPNGTMVDGKSCDGYFHPMVEADGERWNSDPRPGVPNQISIGVMAGSGATGGAMPDAAWNTGASLPRRVKRK